MQKLIRSAAPWLPTLELFLAAGASALWYTQGGWVEYAGSFPGPWPLLLLALMWGLRWISVRIRGRDRSDRRGLAAFGATAPPFVGPLGLFLITAATSLWAAYDLQIATAKAWLLVGALGLFWALAHQPDLNRILTACTLMIVAGAGVALLATLTRDWSATTFDGSALAQAAHTAASLLPPAVAAETLNANVAGGTLLLLLPLSVPVIAAAWRCGSRWRPLVLGVTGAAAAVSLVGLLLTGSRGVYVALASAAVLWGLLRLSQRLSPRARFAGLVAIAVVAIVGTVIGLNTVAGASPAPNAESAPSSLRNRLWLWQLGVSLVRDVPFTGIGIGTFEMALTLYALLIHVGFVEHAHNLYLDIAIEQGSLGAAAFLAMAATAVGWGLRRLLTRGVSSREGDKTRSEARIAAKTITHRLLVEAALVSLATLCVHGLVDDAIYSSRAIVLLLAPFGLLAASARLPWNDGADRIAHRIPPAVSRLGLPVAITLALTALAIGAIVTFSSSCTSAPAGRLRAVWVANLGAVAQARTELAAYDQGRFSEISIGEVRRQEDLSRALGLFDSAIALSPGNRTALQRLAMIELDRMAYNDAYDAMRDAWHAGHRDRGTRLLYSDALVAVGQVEEAVSVVRGLPFARARMLGQAWERYRSRGDSNRAALAYAAAELLE